MKISALIKKFTDKYIFNAKWTCCACGKENFNEKYFCDDCLKELPFNDGFICNHCGRKTASPEEYCLTCREKLLSLDKCRSVFVYEGQIAKTLQKFKYFGARYFAKVFGEYIANLYSKSFFNADYIVFVPMTRSALRKRGYNQTKLLADELSNIVSVPVIDCLVKVKETKNQALLGRKDRLINLNGAFRVTKRKILEGKRLLIVDDITTTGATGEIIASKLKKAGASSVCLLTVASVPSVSKV